MFQRSNVAAGYNRAPKTISFARAMPARAAIRCEPPFSDIRHYFAAPAMTVCRLRYQEIIVKKYVDFPICHTIIRYRLHRPGGFFRRLNASVNVSARFFAPAHGLRFSIKHPRQKNVPDFIVTISGLTGIVHSTIRTRCIFRISTFSLLPLRRIQSRAQSIPPSSL